jgi:hypothetical protein
MSVQETGLALFGCFHALGGWSCCFRHTAALCPAALGCPAAAAPLFQSNKNNNKK